MKRIPVALTLLLFLFAGAAHAQTFPALTGRVVDGANLLDAGQRAELTQLSEQIEAAASRQFVVVTLPDLQGYDIADYGYRLGRQWKIGQAGADNGILLIVAPNERKVRIEVGYGLEPVMTDALASRIINDTILPRFRDGDMAGGIMAGAQAIGEQMKLPLEAAEKRAQAELAAKPRRRSGGGDVNWVPILFWGIVIVFFVLPAVFGRGRGRKYRRGGAPVVIWGPGWGGGGGSGWGGGGSSWGGGGGGFSGGGGSFGGGGASGSW